MDPKKIRIRRVPNVLEIENSLSEHIDEKWGVAHVTWRSSEYFWWVAFYNKSWIAYGAMRWHNATQLYIGPTFVKEEFRGLGLQLRLIRARIRYAKRVLKAKSIISSTDCYNYFSGNNLIKAGFKLAEPWLQVHGLYWKLIL